MRLNRHNVFLFDAFGAVLSGALTGLVLPRFSETLGLPPGVLYGLAALPAAFGLFGLSSYFWARTGAKRNLCILMSLNVAYCLVSGFYMLSSKSITVMGQAVLGIEIIAIAAVVTLEYRVFKAALASYRERAT